MSWTFTGIPMTTRGRDLRYREVKELYIKHGHADIPFSTKSLNDSKCIYQPLMEWAKEQRIQYAMLEQNLHKQHDE